MSDELADEVGSLTDHALPLVRLAWAIRPVVLVLGAANAYATGPGF